MAVQMVIQSALKATIWVFGGFVFDVCCLFLEFFFLAFLGGVWDLCLAIQTVRIELEKNQVSYAISQGHQLKIREIRNFSEKG